MQSNVASQVMMRDSQLPRGCMQSAQLVEAAIERLGPAQRSPLPLGNKPDAYDELVYILLTIMTRSQPRIDQAYGSLQRAAGGSWDGLLQVERGELDRILAPLGFVNRRGEQLLELVARIKEDHHGDLDFLSEVPDRDALELLTSLPGIGTKSAKCVMLYCFGRAVLPVDVHVLRVAKRLGLTPMDVPWEQVDRSLEATVPDELKYDVHVQFVVHGREVCKSRGALCHECVLLDLCPSGPLPPDRRADYT